MNASRRTALFSVAASAALALSLSACQSGEGTKAEGAAAPVAKNSASAAASAPAAAATTTGTGADTGTNTGAATAVGTANKSNSGSAGAKKGTTTPLCRAQDVKVSSERQDGPPYTHIILTARNTSNHRCEMAGFPHIQFLEGHKQDVPSVAKSKPAVPTVLNPGDPAFVLVKLSDGGVHEDNEVVNAFQLILEGDSTVIAVDSSAGGGLAVDPAKTLTGYWTTELRNGADDF
ncbi:DUF4232 domain-containing protein [Streptomyces sp. SID2999]|uniref:DUF4232 domain-containing protein n=1 Tax=Streptomyces sp. SID2999 TaxID=2690258 RepID=UPI00136D7B1E|nr:DUF4232 domain-containing protein [Streptomyces sp. SID2999]MYZ07847.1 DUF4232 domain-containing protein [Streptomyces sp. SID2999]